jgi:hypothetical protein
MVMPELVLIVKRKVVIRLKNPMNGANEAMDEGVTECWSNRVGGEPDFAPSLRLREATSGGPL